MEDVSENGGRNGAGRIKLKRNHSAHHHPSLDRVYKREMVDQASASEGTTHLLQTVVERTIMSAIASAVVSLSYFLISKFRINYI